VALDRVGGGADVLGGDLHERAEESSDRCRDFPRQLACTLARRRGAP
jgi:hypothetical protein